MKPELRDRLRQAMADRHITQKALADKSGVSQSNIAYILSGRNKSVTASNLDKLASSLGVSIAWLSGETNAVGRNLATVPFKRFDPSLRGFTDSDKPPLTYDQSYLSEKLEGFGVVDDCFAMDVPSDNMSPLLGLGDVVTVNGKDIDPSAHRKPRIFVVQSGKVIGIYRIVVNIGQIKLESLNPVYDSVKCTSDVLGSSITVIGRVVDRQGSSGL